MKLVVYAETSALKEIEHLFVSFYITNQIEGETVHLFHTPAQILDYVETQENCDSIFFLSILGDGQELFAVELARRIRKHNKFTHIVFIAPGYQYLPACLTDLIRPSQYLIAPINNQEIFTLLSNIYNDSLVDMLKVRVGGYYYYIRISKILYIEKDGKKAIFFSDTSKIETYATLQEIYQKCEGEMLYANKGQLVNSRHIVKVENGKKLLHLTDGSVISISRNTKKNFL